MSTRMNIKKGIEEMENWLKELEEHQKGVQVWDTKNTMTVLKQLGDPHVKYTTIHVAGTNGKGSTVAFLKQIGVEAGYNVGVYTSPHLIRKNERIAVNNKHITDRQLCKCVVRIKTCVDNLGISLSFFEALTVAAYIFFAEQKVDFAILETGLGGTLDATNTCKSVITAITNIAIEHTDHLGRTVQSIAENKAGIIKKNQVCIIAKDGIPKKAREVIMRRAKQQNTKMIIAHPVQQKTGLAGTFQKQNAGIAKEIARQLIRKGFKITEEQIKKGIQKTRWPGRLEWLRENVLIDAAHNVHAIAAILPELRRIKKKFKRTTLVFGVLEDKAYKEMLCLLLKIDPTEIVLTEPASERACSVQKLKPFIKKSNIPYEEIKDKQEIITRIREVSKEDLVIITGSIYVIGEIKGLFLSTARNKTTKEYVHSQITMYSK